MTIGIIGSGAIGTAFARTLSRAGIEATISNSRGPDSLKELVRELGPSIKAGTREEAARVLETLHRRGLIAAAGETPLYSFKPAREDMRGIVAEVADAYRRHLISIAVYIHRKSSASVREFARAFDLKKER